MSRRRERAAILAIAAGLALGGCGGSDSRGSQSKTPNYAAALRGAPPALAALYRQGDKLLDGGTDAFQKRIQTLHGHPVVVNNWASWCGPCIVEFPFFQQEVAKQGTKVAFLGVNSNDSEAAAKTFLSDHPVPYPSFSDPSWDISDQEVSGIRVLPKTAFYDSSGNRVYLHTGQYQSEADLAADIKRYTQ